MSTPAATSAARAAIRSASRRLVDSVPNEVVDDIYKCSFKKQTGVSLKYMMDFGSMPLERQLLLSAQFLHKELPVRLAHRVAELENLPHGLSTKVPVRKVRDWYVESFRDLRAFQSVQDMHDERKFTSLLERVYSRHNNVVPLMATGVAELKEELGASYADDKFPEIHQFLDRFYLSRIGIRMLIGQHIAINEDVPQEKEQRKRRDDYIGLICTKLSPVVVAENAVADARSVCARAYGEAPEVDIFGDRDFQFAYVPEHLHQMIFELVKNSLRAVMDRFQDSDEPAPPIRVVVAEGGEDVTIKISDEGGGIPRSGLPRIWTYLYSTARNPLPSTDEEGNIRMEGSPVLAGYGYGLPLSRLYAKYFGGDLQVISMEGYGMDAYLHLHRLGTFLEPLP